MLRELYKETKQDGMPDTSEHTVVNGPATITHGDNRWTVRTDNAEIQQMLRETAESEGCAIETVMHAIAEQAVALVRNGTTIEENDQRPD